MKNQQGETPAGHKELETCISPFLASAFAHLPTYRRIEKTNTKKLKLRGTL